MSLLLRCLLIAATAAVAQAQPQPLASRTDLAALYSLRATLAAGAARGTGGVDCATDRVVGVTAAGLRRTRLATAALAPPPSLALAGLRNLTALARFNASRFALPGEIPAWFGAGLPRPLAVLDRTGAAVSGTLLPDLGASGNPTLLLLSGNHVPGNVSAALLSVAGLRVDGCSTSRNNLTGALPNASVFVSRGASDAANASVFSSSTCPATSRIELGTGLTQQCLPLPIASTACRVSEVVRIVRSFTGSKASSLLIL